MIQIELDNLRISKYQELKNNLEAVKEFFRHGDILIKQINSILEETQNLLDNNLETSFNKEDFNEMLNLRNEVLYPIFQNASFAKTFEEYVDGVVKPIIEPIKSSTVSYNTNNGVLNSVTIIDKLDDNPYKTTTLTYNNNIITDSRVVEGNTTTVSKFIDGTISSKIITMLDGNTLELTNNVYENGELSTSSFSKFVDGLLIT